MITDETKQIRRIALFAFLLNLALAAMKTILAVLSDSMAITASVIDSITDSVASLAVYFGIRLSARKTKKFPLGLYKLENVLSIIIAIFIFVSGYEIARTSFQPRTFSAPSISGYTLALLVGAIIAVFLFGRYALIHGRKTGSPTLIAEGKHRQADVLSSAVVLASSALSYFQVNFALGWMTLDRLAAIIVVAFIARSGWQLLSDGMRVLLDASLDRETLEKVRQIIASEPAAEEIRELVGRNAGRYCFLQCVVALNESNLKKAHTISEKIEEAITDQIPNVERVIIHIEPLKKDREIIAVPVAENRHSVSSNFGDAPYYALFSYHNGTGELMLEETLPNPHANREKGRGLKAAEWLLEKSIDIVVLSREAGKKGFYYALQSKGVELLVIKADSVDQIAAILPDMLR